MANELSTVQSLQGLMNNVGVKKRFEDMLGKKSAGFMSSIMTITNGNQQLQQCDAKTILSAAGIAAALDLPINPNLGFAAIVPYGKEATFQMMYKGYVQLAMRTAQYEALNCSEVYEGELISRNRVTGQIVFDFDKKSSDKIIGYCAYLKMTNGLEKYLYMTIEEVEAHAKKYSQTYKSSKDFVRNKSKWTTDFDAMALKTVLKLLISKWGIMSIDMQTAVLADQSVVKQDSQGNVVDYKYADNTIDVSAESANSETIDIDQPENTSTAQNIKTETVTIDVVAEEDPF
jgi:recombination protein RecT